MARDVTFLQLRTGVRKLTDTENDPHKDEAWIGELVNDARAEVFDILRRADPNFYESVQAITTTAVENDTYALSPDHHLTKGVAWLGTSGYYEPLEAIDYRRTFCYQVKIGYAAAYRVVGGNLVLYPPPPAGQTYKHTYTPCAVLLAADAATVDGREAELIRLRAAIRIKHKEDADTTALERLFESELNRITAQTEDRAGIETNAIADVEDYGNVSRWMKLMPRPPRP